MSETKEKPRSKLPSDFDWTSHYAHEDTPTEALCGKKLLGIEAREENICEECLRIMREHG